MYESKLELVLRLTSEEEKQAAVMFKAMQDDYTNAEDALNQALRYRVEYEEMSRGARHNKFIPMQLKVARSFLANIDGLIEKQRIILRTKLEALETRRQHWQLLRARTKSIEALIASRDKSRQMIEEKKEQRRLDDLFVR